MPRAPNTRRLCLRIGSIRLSPPLHRTVLTASTPPWGKERSFMRLPYTKTSIIFADSTSHQCSPGRKRKVPRPVFISVNLHGPTKGPFAFDGHLPLGDAIFPRYPVRQIGERLQARPRSIEQEVRKGMAAGFACRPGRYEVLL
jgi:hypothetical protein